ncbi:MAG: putative repeat protein (TIGR04138 family) [Rhodothermales bacterium]|jgi:uncharacterized repeat protein (TIGR04138 family)
MTSPDQYFAQVRVIADADGRYKPQAFIFVQEAVSYSIEQLQRKNNAGKPQHISGQELLRGIRDFALEQLGPMTSPVFDDWGLTCTDDFGHIVFLMVREQLLGASDTDRLEDFSNGYDFHEAFAKNYLPKGKAVVVPVVA